MIVYTTILAGQVPDWLSFLGLTVGIDLILFVCWRQRNNLHKFEWSSVSACITNGGSIHAS
jgi:hypothetical protein